MLKQKKDIGETRVFHGTKNNNISAICKQGFDFRLNGQATGETVFFLSFSYDKTQSVEKIYSYLL
jgi:hypothetical protein